MRMIRKSFTRQRIAIMQKVSRRLIASSFSTKTPQKAFKVQSRDDIVPKKGFTLVWEKQLDPGFFLGRRAFSTSKVVEESNAEKELNQADWESFLLKASKSKAFKAEANLIARKLSEGRFMTLKSVWDTQLFDLMKVLGLAAGTVSELQSLCKQPHKGHLLTREWPHVNEADFPFQGVGQRVLTRDALVNKAFQRIEDAWKDCPKKRNTHYYRGGAGCGKTVFLALLKRKLELNGYLAFVLDDASDLARLNRTVWIEILAEAQRETKRAIVLVDEVGKNPNVGWSYLLRSSEINNLAVIGVGIPPLPAGPASPPFSYKYSAREMLLTKDDLEQAQSIMNVSSDILNWLMRYTGGHCFPLVQIAEYIKNQNLEFSTEEQFQNFLTSEHFRNSKISNDIKARCFDLNGAIIASAWHVFRGNRAPDIVEPLLDLAFWDPETSWFSSNIILEVLFNASISAVDSPKATLHAGDWLSQIGEVIKVGLSGMKPDEFVTQSGGYSYENAISFHWGFHAQAALGSLYLQPQSQIERVGRGTNPTIDFFANGRLRTYIECAKNVSDLTGKLEKFIIPGKQYYKKEILKRFVIFHFDLRAREPQTPLHLPELYPDYHDRIFTFVKTHNALFQGSKRIALNLVQDLPSVPLPD